MGDKGKFMVSFTSNDGIAKALILGGAVGDAYGAPFEYTFQRGKFTPSWTSAAITGGGLIGRAPKGTWTDDTSMTLATIASLKDNDGNVNTTDMLFKYAEWVQNGAYTIDGVCTDCGNTTYRAISPFVESIILAQINHTKRRAIPQRYICDDEHSNGNGSLMRIAPLALTDATDDEIMHISATTHAHPVSMHACVQWVHALRLVIGGMDAADAFAESARYMRASGMGSVSERFAHIGDYDKSEISGKGYVVSTMEAAAWSVINADSYEQSVFNACSLGDDTDTVACIAGSVAGVIHGIGGTNGIPEQWIQDLRGMELINTAINEIESL